MNDEKRPLSIVTFPENSLREPSELVSEFDENLHNLIDDMIYTTEAYSGLGLAAVQVGRNIKVMIVKQDAEWIEMINPVVTTFGDLVNKREGCLSIPGYYEFIKRPSSAHVSYQNRNGGREEITASGNLATEIQHEFDHLNGKLFIDHMSKLKKRMFEAWMRKQIKKITRYREAIMTEVQNKIIQDSIEAPEAVVETTEETKSEEKVAADGSKSVTIQAETLALAAKG